MLNRDGPFRVKHLRALGIKKRRAIDWVEKGYIQPEVKESTKGRGDIRLFSYKNLVEFAFLHTLNERGIPPTNGRWELEGIKEMGHYDLSSPPPEDRGKDFIWLHGQIGPEAKWYWQVSASEKTIEVFEEGRFGGEISVPFCGKFAEEKETLSEHTHTCRATITVNVDNLKRAVDHVLKLAS